MNFETLKPFCLLFLHWHAEGFLSKRIALKVDVSEDRKIYYSQARPCIFQPGHFTGSGSDGVKLLVSMSTVTYFIPRAHTGTFNS